MLTVEEARRTDQIYWNFVLCANSFFRQSQFERRVQNDFSLNRISVPFLNWRIYVWLSIFSQLTCVYVSVPNAHSG